MSSDPKKHLDEEGVAKKSVRKMDTLVTGMILWGIIASIYGVKKITEKSEHDDHKTHMVPKNAEHDDRTHLEAKKRGILSRIFFGNK